MITNKYKLTFCLTLSLIIMALNSTAQTSDSLINDLAIKWKNAKAYTLQMAQMMPEENYGFKPVPEEMSFGKQLLHIADNINWLSSAYLFGNKPAENADTSSLNKQAIINTVSAAYDSAYAAQLRLTEKQLNETVDFFAGSKTRRQILILLHDHQTHHDGQLIVYLRLKGIKPPDYVGW